MDFKRILCTSILVLSSPYIVAQAKKPAIKKPTIMVVPADDWLTKNGYSEKVETDEGEETIYHYKDALDNDPDLGDVIAKINSLMNGREFPLEHLNSKLSSGRGGMNNLLKRAKRKNSRLSANQADKVRGKSDITLAVSWKLHSNGPYKQVTYRLVGLDAATEKAIASEVGTGPKSLGNLTSELLSEAIVDKMDNFTNQLQNYFNDILENGREVKFAVVIGENWDKDLDSEFNGKRLSNIIEDWMNQKTVNKRFSVADQDEYVMEFIQVRIPLYNEKGDAIATRNFVEMLQDYLKSLGITKSKIIMDGLGAALLTLGD